MSVSFKNDYYRLHVIEMVQHREPDVFTDEVFTEIINCAKDKNYSSYSSLISSYLNINNDDQILLHINYKLSNVLLNYQFAFSKYYNISFSFLW